MENQMEHTTENDVNLRFEMVHRVEGFRGGS